MPFRLRAARPIVWISERSAAQEAFLVGVEDADERDLGNVEALAKQVDADEHVELAAPQIADDLDALERVDVGVEVADADADLAVVLGQILGHALGQRGDEHAVALLGALADLGEQVVDLVRDRADLDLGIEQAGRPDDLLDDDALRLVELVVAPASPRRRSSASRAARHSSNLSGRLSSALGRRKPNSTSVSLRERSPLYIAPICGTVWCDSSTTSRKSSGK